MKLATKTVLMAMMLAGSASAMAGPMLTQRQCNDYPFKPLKAEVTHKQLMRELGELEAEGYQPSSDDNLYPADLQAAQKKLNADYRADCLPASPMKNARGINDTTAPGGMNTPNPAS